MIHCETIFVSVNGAGGGTVVSRPVVGDIISIRLPGTALGGSADFTITRQSDGGTVLAGTDMAGPWQYQPASAFHSGTAIAGTTVGVPSASHLVVTVGSAAASTGGTIHVYYRV